VSDPAGGVARPVGQGPPLTQRESSDRMNLLAVGTGLRIAMAPVFMWLVLGGEDTIAAIVFLVAAATDWIDGRLARRWEVTSRLGSFLDTTADKLLVTAALVVLVAVDRASPWLAMLIIARELVLLGLRAAVATDGRHLEPSLLGKWKATIQFAAIALVTLRADVIVAGEYLDEWALALAALVTVWSGVDYFVRFSSALRSPS
jgi:CDP-diacylglycerol--glycerol-3-phosphate 3-phosphatidyltransferase